MIVFLVTYLSVFAVFNYGKSALTINDTLPRAITGVNR